MKRVLLVVLLTGMAQIGYAKNGIRVYVFTQTDSSGLTDDATEARLGTVSTLKKFLAKNETVELVDDRDAAKVVVEITGVPKESIGTSASTVAGVGRVGVVTPGQDLVVPTGHATVTSGTFRTELSSTAGPFGRTVGENIGRKLLEWVKRNSAALQAR